VNGSRQRVYRLKPTDDTYLPSKKLGLSSIPSDSGWKPKDEERGREFVGNRSPSQCFPKGHKKDH